MKLEVVTAASVDYDEIVRLQREAFFGVASQEQLDANQTPQYYKWKYTMAGGEARVAQVRDAGGMLVAMNSMFPLALTDGTRTVRGWQSCDTSTHPKARGQGWFVKCLQALKATLSDGDIFFGFPNRNSTTGFVKSGCQRLSILSMFAGIIPTFRPRPFVERIERYGPEQDALARRLPGGRMMIARTAAYLNDRYHSPQKSLYTSFVYQGQGGPEGFLVVRPLLMYRMRFGLVMECMATSLDIERELHLHAGSWCRQEGIIFALTLNNVSDRGALMSRGLFPVPQRITPRPVVLMAEVMGAGPLPSQWASHVGDWDVF
ncbi:MAG TPA: hypothetical protein VGO93_06705 [Candidatus Xenobia bacterium]